MLFLKIQGGLTAIKVKINNLSKGGFSVKKHLLALVLCCAVFLGCSPAALAFAVDAKAAVLMDAATGRIIFEQNAHESLPPASTTKILTALLTLENVTDLQKTVTLPADFVNVGESGVYLEAGETHTFLDLLYALLLRSANDAGQALAIGVSGSEEAFVALMNKRSQELGLKDSSWANPHGLDDDKHLTSAYDLAKITQEAFKHDLFNEIIVAESWTMPWQGNSYDSSLYNHNQFLDLYEGGDGVKTGYTGQSGSCLVASATRDGMRLIGVVLGCADQAHYDEMIKLMDYGFSGYEAVKVGSAGDVVGSVKVINGNITAVNAVLGQDVVLAVEKGERFKPQPAYDFPAALEAPFQASEPIGLATYLDTAGNKAEAPIYAAKGATLYTFGLVFKSCWQAFIAAFL